MTAPKKILIEFVGWYGVLAILAAYALVSFGALSPASVWYQTLNGTGALGIVVKSISKRDYQPAVLNLIWTAIAAAALLRLFLQF